MLSRTKSETDCHRNISFSKPKAREQRQQVEKYGTDTVTDTATDTHAHARAHTRTQHTAHILPGPLPVLFSFSPLTGSSHRTRIELAIELVGRDIELVELMKFKKEENSFLF